MEVKIKFLPQKTSDIDYARQVKDIAKDLVRICEECGVTTLTYLHEFFEIHISQRILISKQDSN